jgi:Arc/MetJ-type ribon-helix-helix transcriptional regulator
MVRKEVEIKYGYASVVLRQDLINAIREKIKNDPSYTGVAEFIRTAIREKLEKIN